MKIWRNDWWILYTSDYKKDNVDRVPQVDKKVLGKFKDERMEKF